MWLRLVSLWFTCKRFRPIRGIRNVVRWTPVIWNDFDFDSGPLLDVMEFKLRRMVHEFETNGVTATAPRCAQQMRVAAALCKRLTDDEYGWGIEEVPEPERALFMKRERARQMSDQRYLGHLIGKHLTSWWD